MWPPKFLTIGLPSARTFFMRVPSFCCCCCGRRWDAVSAADRLIPRRLLRGKGIHPVFTHLPAETEILRDKGKQQRTGNGDIGDQRPFARPAVARIAREIEDDIPEAVAGILRVFRLPHGQGAVIEHRIPDAHADLVRYGARGLVRGERWPQFVHRAVGQGDGQKEPCRHQQPAEEDHAAAHLAPQEAPGQHEDEDQDAAHQGGFQQPVEDRYAAEGEPPVVVEKGEQFLLKIHRSVFFLSLSVQV